MTGVSSPRLQARIAGFLYLIVVVASVFALNTASTLIVRDASATVANITAAEPLFRLAFAANLLAAVSYTAVVAILCVLFQPVSKTLSLVAAFIGLAGCATSAAFMINQLSALSLAGVDAAHGAFTVEQMHALARQSLRTGGLGNNVSLVFFGFYCVLLGWLVSGATFVPRILALPLMIAGVGWLLGNFALFLAPAEGAALARILLPVSGLGELLFTLWLLFVGVNPKKWRAQAGEPIEVS